MTTHWINTMYKQFVTVSLCAVLAACSTSKEKLFNSDKPTMKEVYTQTFHHPKKSPRITIERPLVLVTAKDSQAVAVPPSVAPSLGELQQQFPKAPNPMLLMLVFPHLTQAGTPVPEYSTYFHLYETDYFMVRQRIPEGTHDAVNKGE